MTDAPSKSSFEDRYLGDGVYASFDGYHIWLKTQEGMSIALEPPVKAALDGYERDLIAYFRAGGG